MTGPHDERPPPATAPPFDHHLRHPDGPASAVLVVEPPFTAESTARLCDHVAFLFITSGVDTVTCDVGAIARPDASCVDALARMQVTAKDLGRSIRLRHASSFLRGLLDLTGLSDVLPDADARRPGPDTDPGTEGR